MKKYYFRGFEDVEYKASGEVEKLMVFERYDNEEEVDEVFSIEISDNFLLALSEVKEKLPY